MKMEGLVVKRNLANVAAVTVTATVIMCMSVLGAQTAVNANVKEVKEVKEVQVVNVDDVPIATDTEAIQTAYPAAVVKTVNTCVHGYEVGTCGVCLNNSYNYSNGTAYNQTYNYCAHGNIVGSCGSCGNYGNGCGNGNGYWRSGGHGGGHHNGYGHH